MSCKAMCGCGRLDRCGCCSTPMFPMYQQQNKAKERDWLHVEERNEVKRKERYFRFCCSGLLAPSFFFTFSFSLSMLPSCVAAVRRRLPLGVSILFPPPLTASTLPFLELILEVIIRFPFLSHSFSQRQDQVRRCHPPATRLYA